MPVQAGDLHQAAADHAVVDQHLHVAGRGAQQGRHGIAGARQRQVAMKLAQRLLHGRRSREELFQAQAPRMHLDPPGQRRSGAVQARRRGHAAARHAELQWIQRQHAVLQDHVDAEIGQGQLAVVDDAGRFQRHIGIHVAPTIGAECLRRQDLAAGRPGGRALVLVLGRRRLARGHADQRPQVGHAQQRTSLPVSLGRGAPARRIRRRAGRYCRPCR